MKLNELLKNAFTKSDLDQNYHLGSKELKVIKEALLQCEEFKDVDELIIMDAPSSEFKNKDGSTFNIHSNTTKLMKDTKYKGTCYLYSISLSPCFYSRLLATVKNNVGFIPAIINPNTYETEKIITVAVPVDSEKEQIKTILLNLANDLDNINEYALPQERSIGIRGFFLEEMHETNSKELVIEDNEPIVKDVYRPEPEIIIFNKK